jgi:hypothetical protein
MTYLTTIAPRLLNYGRGASLDKETVTRTIDIERSSSAKRGRQERIGEDSFKAISGGVRSPLEGKATERSQGREEEMDSTNDAELDPEIVMQHINEYFDEVKPREFLEDIRNWSPGYVEYMGWKSFYDKETEEVADFVPSEWPAKK